MFRAASVLAALLVTGLMLAATASAQDSSKKRHRLTPAELKQEASCKKQANAQKLNFTARLNFLESCMKGKPK
jgi:hypothetical protein